MQQVSGTWGTAAPHVLDEQEKKEKETHKVFNSQINRTQIEHMCEIYMQHMVMHWREDVISFVNLISGLQS